MPNYRFAQRKNISKERLGLEIENKMMDTIEDLEATVAKSIEKLGRYEEQDQAIELKDFLATLGRFKEKVYKAGKKITIIDWLKDIGAWVKKLFSGKKKTKK